jgi:hypothetical protein
LRMLGRCALMFLTCFFFFLSDAARHVPTTTLIHLYRERKKGKTAIGVANFTFSTDVRHITKSPNPVREQPGKKIL